MTRGDTSGNISNVRQGRQRGNVRVDQTRHHLVQEIASKKMAEGAMAGMSELGRCGHDYWTRSALVVIIPATTATILPNQYKIDHNSLNFRARSLKFCMQVDLDRPQLKNIKT